MSGHNQQREHSGCDWVVPDPGDAGPIPCGQSGVCALTTAAAETRTLARPKYSGEQLILMCRTYVGDCVVTTTPAINELGNNTITFASAGESIFLYGVPLGAVLVWRALAPHPHGDGPQLTTV